MILGLLLLRSMLESRLVGEEIGGEDCNVRYSNLCVTSVCRSSVTFRVTLVIVACVTDGGMGSRLV
jgi:hypothetical protein